MGTTAKEHKKSSSPKFSTFEKAFAAARKKAGGPNGIFTFKGEKYTTAYKGEKINKKVEKKKEEVNAKSSGVNKNKMMDFEPKGKSKTMIEFLDAKNKVKSKKKPSSEKKSSSVTMSATEGKRLAMSDREILAAKKKAGTGGSGSVSVTVISAADKKSKKKKDSFPGIPQSVKDFFKKKEPTSKELIKDFRKDLKKVDDSNKANFKKILNSSIYKTLPSKTQRMIRNIAEGKIPMSEMAKKREIKKLMGSGMNVGGLTSSAMQNGLSRKISPSTGLTMNKGGMTDYRKSGMFYGGGMTRRGK